MDRNQRKNQLIQHKERALRKLNSYMISLIDSSDPKCNGKSDKLSYWLEDWTTFLDYESSFSPSSLKRYKRGEIIKVHLGFNIGSEEGGLHYAVVVEKDNSIHNPVITIVPLTSIKPTKDTSHLKNGEVLLGNELYTKLFSKFSSKLSSTEEAYLDLEKEMKQHENSDPAFHSGTNNVNSRLKLICDQLDFLKKMKAEISKMKCGSIALVNQITTISKIRIYNPKTTKDILSGITLSNDGLDKIDKELIRKYTK